MKYSDEEKNISSLFFKANKILYKNIPNYTTASFDYTNIEEELYKNEYPFKYKDFPIFGNYEFEYDIEDIGQYSLRYAFLYNDSPVHGNYQFYYRMNKDIYKHKEVLINKYHKNIYEKDSYNLLKHNNIKHIDINMNKLNMLNIDDIDEIILSNYYKVIGNRINNIELNRDVLLNMFRNDYINKFVEEYIVSQYGNDSIVKYNTDEILKKIKNDISLNDNLVEINIDTIKPRFHIGNISRTKTSFKHRKNISNKDINKYLYKTITNSLSGQASVEFDDISSYYIDNHNRNSYIDKNEELSNIIIRNSYNQKDENILNAKLIDRISDIKDNSCKANQIEKYVAINKDRVSNRVIKSFKTTEIKDSYNFVNKKIAKKSNSNSKNNVKKITKWHKSSKSTDSIVNSIKWHKSSKSTDNMASIIKWHKLSKTTDNVINVIKWHKLGSVIDNEFKSKKIAKNINYYKNTVDINKIVKISNKKYSYDSEKTLNKIEKYISNFKINTGLNKIFKDINNSEFIKKLSKVYKNTSIYKLEHNLKKIALSNELTLFGVDKTLNKIVGNNNKLKLDLDALLKKVEDIKLVNINKDIALNKLNNINKVAIDKDLKINILGNKDITIDKDVVFDKFNKSISISNDFILRKVSKNIDINDVKLLNKISHDVSINDILKTKEVPKDVFIAKEKLLKDIGNIFDLIVEEYVNLSPKEKDNYFDLIIENDKLVDNLSKSSDNGIILEEFIMLDNSIEKEFNFIVEKYIQAKNSISKTQNVIIEKDIITIVNEMLKDNDIFIEYDLNLDKIEKLVNIENYKLLKPIRKQWDLNIEKDILLKPTRKQWSLNIENDKLLSSVRKQWDLNIENDILLDTERIFKNDVIDNNKFTFSKSKTSNIDEGLNKANLGIIRKALVEYDEQLKLKNRLWFIKGYGQIDYKIVPNEDNLYPAQINMFLDDIYDYKFNYSEEIPKNSNLIIEFYNRDYDDLGVIEFNKLRNRNGKYKNVNYKIDISETYDDKFIVLDLDLEINKKDDLVEYIIIRHKKSKRGILVTYLTSEEFISNKHPIPIGEDMGIKELDLPISIMVEFINILLLFWSKFYYAFSGYSGTQAIYGLINVVHDWLTLEESQSEESIDYYERCFRWFRWESEKVYQRAKQNLEYAGNFWIEEVIFELIDYMETHHLNIERYLNVHLQDEFRDIFKDPEFDLYQTIDRVKGIRNRVLRKRNELD